MLTPKVTVDRDLESGAAVTEGRADARAGRLSPSFTSAEEIEVWQETRGYRNFVSKA